MQVRRSCRSLFVLLGVIGFAAVAVAAVPHDVVNRNGGPPLADRVLPMVTLDSIVSSAELKTLPQNTVFQRYVIGQGLVDGGASGEAAIVYQNTNDHPVALALEPGLRVADDLRTICAGSNLTRVEVGVSGGGDGTGPGFNIQFQLFNGCPSGGGTAIAGTSHSVNLPNNGTFMVVLDLSATPVFIPGVVWLAMSTSTPPGAVQAMWIFGGAPEVGTSAEVFDAEFPCTTTYGGCPSAGPACANAYARLDGVECVEVFLAYRADVLSAFFVQMELDELFADDIEPVTAPEPCEIAQYRADLAGLQGQYSMAFEAFNDDVDMLRPGAPVMGTQGNCPGIGNGIVDECFFELSPVVPTETSKFWLIYDVSGNPAGPALTGDFPQIGFSEDCFSIFGQPDPDIWSDCVWFFGGCPISTVGNPCGTFQNRVWCAGTEPTVACCDLDFEGGPCMDDVPITQCNGRRMPGVACAEAQFDPPCGTASCCLLDETCENRLQANCQSGTGLWQPGKFCGEGNQFCPPLACIVATNPCDVPSPTFEPGCNDGFCCNLVCEIDDFCCTVAWDETCVAFADGGCPLPAADECEIALEIACNGVGILDNTLATDVNDDPGFSCHNGGSGQNGIGSVWAKFTATATSARLTTCDSPAPADDSLVAIYRGECGELVEVGCSDDVPGCGPVEFGSDFCVNGLTVGQTYYVQVAAWQLEDIGRYTLEIDCPATCEPPPNDLCGSSQVVTDGITAYSCAGAGTDGPALPSGPQPNGCDEGDGLDFQHDIWFDYTAPVTGSAIADLCSGVGFDSRMAVYSGCTCPVTTMMTLECNDDSLACGPNVNGGSRLTFPITQGQCYKIRVGGHGDVSGTGLLVMTSMGTGTDECPAGAVTFTNPPPGTVDARQPNPVNSPTPLQGIQTITATAPAGALSSCWRMCETGENPPNSIQSVTANGTTYTIQLARPISPGSVTRVSYNPDTGSPTTANYISHPSNVNADSLAAPTDILREIDCLNGLSPMTNCPHGIYSSDIDHSGAAGPADILRVIDLLNGADVFQVWNGTGLPTATCTP